MLNHKKLNKLTERAMNVETCIELLSSGTPVHITVSDDVRQGTFWISLSHEDTSCYEFSQAIQAALSSYHKKVEQEIIRNTTTR